MLIVLGGVLVLVFSHLLAVIEVDESAEDEQEARRGCWGWKPSSVYKKMLKIFPLTSIKIVVVVWQILTQVKNCAGHWEILRVCQCTQMSGLHKIPSW